MDTTKNTTPLVSFVITAYNEEATIRNCLSVFNSITNIPIEIIVIDDGSSDSTEELVQAASIIDPRIVYYWQNNSGVSAARNKGLSFARGTYIMFVDADDMVIAESIEKMICEKEADIIQGVQVSPQQYQASGKVIHIDGQKLVTVCLNRSAYEHSFDGVMPELIQSVHGSYGKLFRRDFLVKNELRFVEGLGLGEDMLFYMECLRKAQNVVLVDVPIYQVVINPHSSTRRFNKLMPGYAETGICLIEETYRNDYLCKTEDVSNAVLAYLAVAVHSYFANTRLRGGIVSKNLTAGLHGRIN